MGNYTLYPGNSEVNIFATLVDDMGNPITGQNITFTLNGVFIRNVTVIEGIVNFTYTFVPEKQNIISGEYFNAGDYNIDISNGVLVFDSVISSNITLDKDKVKINESTIGKVIVVNSGNVKESDLSVVVKLPDNFILDTVPNGAIYDDIYNTLTWFIDDLNLKSSIEFEFTGIFTKSGDYTFNSNIFNNNISINDSTNIETLPNNNTGGTDTSGNNTDGNNTTDNNHNDNNTSDNEDKNTSKNTDDENNNSTNNNKNSNKVSATMKPTGIPITLILLVLLSSLGLITKKKQ